MSLFHHRKLPDHSALLSGHTPPDDIGFESRLLQIWYNNTMASWSDLAPHAHAESDECFIVLRGSLLIEVEGEQHVIGEREFCCFPRGVYHAVISAQTPIETLMIRSPSVADKHYRET